MTLRLLWRLRVTGAVHLTVAGKRYALGTGIRG